MSVNIYNNTVKVHFFLAERHKDAAFTSLKEAFENALSKDELSSWIDKDFGDTKTFEELAEKARWPATVDHDENIVNLSHDGFNVAEEELFFSTIAPFVENGSFVEYEQEGYFSDLKMRYEFFDGTIVKEECYKDYDNDNNEHWHQKS